MRGRLCRLSPKLNRAWLQEEIADILANAELVTEHFKLSREAIERRKAKKMAHLRTWHAMLAKED